MECKEAFLLVIISAKAVCNNNFLKYAQKLVFRQKLNYIIIDKYYFIIITSEYCFYII